MRMNFMRCTACAALLVLIFCAAAFAQDKSPVRIAFDRNSKRIDLITERELPDYTLAERGSIRFFLGRLDQPDDFVNFTHDGVRKANISDLGMMEKVQAQFAIWRLRYKSGSKNTPRIQHLAVSFVPLSVSTKEPERRVYVLLNDLELIDWGNK
ncbi:hypothetical protein LLG96_14695 [bacterium]|nr:hypothetical protein [bacterium]